MSTNDDSAKIINWPGTRAEQAQMLRELADAIEEDEDHVGVIVLQVSGEDLAEHNCHAIYTRYAFLPGSVTVDEMVGFLFREASWRAGGRG